MVTGDGWCAGEGGYVRACLRVKGLNFRGNGYRFPWLELLGVRGKG